MFTAFAHYPQTGRIDMLNVSSVAAGEAWIASAHKTCGSATIRADVCSDGSVHLQGGHCFGRMVAFTEGGLWIRD